MTGLTLVEVGVHRLKDLGEPTRIYRLMVAGVDITLEPTATNLGRLASALEEMEAGSDRQPEPQGVEFPFDAQVLATNGCGH
jgi:hypothetical protein